MVEYRHRLQGSEERLWSTKNRIALEWAGGRESTSIAGNNGSRLSAHARDDHARDDGGQANNEEDSRLGLEEDSRGVSWERVYRGKRSECVIGSLAQGTHMRHE